MFSFKEQGVMDFGKRFPSNPASKKKLSEAKLPESFFGKKCKYPSSLLPEHYFRNSNLNNGTENPKTVTLSYQVKFRPLAGFKIENPSQLLKVDLQSATHTANCLSSKMTVGFRHEKTKSNQSIAVGLSH